jgi:hypothetical protein
MSASNIQITRRKKKKEETGETRMFSGRKRKVLIEFRTKPFCKDNIEKELSNDKLV